MPEDMGLWTPAQSMVAMAESTTEPPWFCSMSLKLKNMQDVAVNCTFTTENSSFEIYCFILYL